MNNTKKKSHTIVRLFFFGRDGRIRLSTRYASRSFAALDVHRTSIHYRSYFKSLIFFTIKIKNKLSSLSATELWCG